MANRHIRRVSLADFQQKKPLKLYIHTTKINYIVATVVQIVIISINWALKVVLKNNHLLPQFKKIKSCVLRVKRATTMPWVTITINYGTVFGNMHLRYQNDNGIL